MTRKSYVQIDGVLYDKADGYEAESRAVKGDTAMWNDREYQDMGDPRFNSRSSHREFMKRNNLTTIDDMSGVWKSNEYARNQAKAGIDPSRKQDINRAMQKVQQGYKPKLSNGA